MPKELKTINNHNGLRKDDSESPNIQAGKGRLPEGSYFIAIFEVRLQTNIDDDTNEETHEFIFKVRLNTGSKIELPHFAFVPSTLDSLCRNFMRRFDLPQNRGLTIFIDNQIQILTRFCNEHNYNFIQLPKNPEGILKDQKKTYSGSGYRRRGRPCKYPGAASLREAKTKKQMEYRATRTPQEVKADSAARQDRRNAQRQLKVSLGQLTVDGQWISTSSERSAKEGCIRGNNNKSWPNIIFLKNRGEWSELWLKLACRHQNRTTTLPPKFCLELG
jgi:hypothetical protein